MSLKSPIAEPTLKERFEALRHFIDYRSITQEEHRIMKEHVDAIDIFYNHKGAV